MIQATIHKFIPRSSSLLMSHGVGKSCHNGDQKGHLHAVKYLPVMTALNMLKPLRQFTIRVLPALCTAAVFIATAEFTACINPTTLIDYPAAMGVVYPQAIVAMFEYNNLDYAGKAFNQLRTGQYETYEQDKDSFLSGKLHYAIPESLFSGYIFTGLAMISWQATRIYNGICDGTVKIHPFLYPKKVIGNS